MGSLVLTLHLMGSCHAYATAYKGIAVQRDVGIPITQHMDHVVDIAITHGVHTAYTYGLTVVLVYGQLQGSTPKTIYGNVYNQCLGQIQPTGV